MASSATPSTSYTPGELLGSVTPRLWTRPLVTGPPGPCGCGCPLTPETSDGYDVEWFAENVLGTPLDPWERWLAVHALELRPDGSPRFRHILVIVARQQGKTWLLVVLCLYWLFVDKVRLILSTSTNLDYAIEAWEAGVDLAKETPSLAAKLPPVRNRGVTLGNGKQTLRTADKARWKIAASNRRGGRSLSIDRLVLDELREHDSWDAWNASVPATNARPGSMVWAFSNMGDDRGIVLDSRRTAALSNTDPAHFLAEWSMPDEWRTRVHHATDDELVSALAMSNPNLGLRVNPDVLLGDAHAAIAAGGEELGKFLTEIGCIRIRSRDPAIDAGKWGDLVDPHDLAELTRRTAFCLDVSLDGQHAALVAAAVLPDDPHGRVAVDVVAAWSGPTCTRDLRRDLPGIVGRIKPRVVGWFPAGPAAQIAADMQARRREGWPPRRVRLEEIRGDVTAACMELAEQVRAGQIAHPGDPMLDGHVTGAEKLTMGDAWRFTRRDVGHCDGAYATAGAVRLARLLPPPPAPLSSG